MEDPAGLMHPQAQHGVLAGAGAGRDHEQALKHLGQVTQVEGVVALGRGGQQLLRDPRQEGEGKRQGGG